MVVMYDANEMTIPKTMTRWRGTMMPLVLRKPAFWILVSVHGILQAIKGYDLVNLPQFAWQSTGVISGIVTFFLVFYMNQCYGRMMGFWGHCVGLGGSTMNWVALVANHFPDDPNQQWNAVRLVLAAMHIQYYTLNESSGGAAIEDDEWAVIIGRNLLTEDEIDKIKKYGGYKPFLPLVWALSEVEYALVGESPQTEQDRFYKSDLLSNFRELAFAFRGHCGQISNGKTTATTNCPLHGDCPLHANCPLHADCIQPPLLHCLPPLTHPLLLSPLALIPPAANGAAAPLPPPLPLLPMLLLPAAAHTASPHLGCHVTLGALCACLRQA